MRVEIFGKNYQVSESLRAITDKKCMKLDKYFDNDKEAFAKFIVSRDNGLYITELVVVSRAQTYRASSASGSPFDNIDEILPKLIAQVSRQKDIWTSGKKVAAKTEDADGAEDIADAEEL